MKKIILFSIVALAQHIVQAQADYKTVMLKNIRALDTTRDAQALNDIGSVFAAIYEFRKEWLPQYYECLAYIRSSESYTNDEQKKSVMEKAGAVLAKLPQDNDEVLVLRALYGMDNLAIDRTAWQTFLPMINNSLKKAIEINPQNPRAYYLKGLIKYNMPASMGGGREEGMQLFRQALEKYQARDTADELRPAWGKKELENYLSGK